MFLSDIIPDASTLLNLEPEELAGAVLEVLHATTSSRPNKNVHPYNDGRGMVSQYTEQRDECERAVSEAWAMLVGLGFLARDPGQTAEWYFITRRGGKVRSRTDFQSFRYASMFPRESLHQSIAEKTFALFVRGEYENAVFQAFKAVEIAVRGACGDHVKRELVGTHLMRAAFNPKNGPLTDTNETQAEKEALMNLFAGAIGRFKNPSSHRHVELEDPLETIEMLQFASHLLRVVDDRSGLPG